MLGEYLGPPRLRRHPRRDAEELRAALEGAAVELVVLDIAMPGEDGLSVLRSLRAGRPAAAGDHADRRGRDDRPHPRPRDGRRRLPRQARRPARARGAHQGGAAPRRRPRAARDAAASPLALRPLLARHRGGQALRRGRRRGAADRDGVRPPQALRREPRPRAQPRPDPRGAHDRSWDPFDRSIDIRISRIRRKIEPTPRSPRSSAPSAASATSTTRCSGSPRSSAAA
jgi:hypothetical protein